MAQDYTITKLKLFPDRDEVLIKDLASDSKGFVWFLTNGEIYRYDGYRSLDVLRTIADQAHTADMPQRILVDRHDRLWMAGNANLSYLDLRTWHVHPVAPALLPPVQDRAVFSIRRALRCNRCHSLRKRTFTACERGSSFFGWTIFSSLVRNPAINYLRGA